MNLEQFEVAIGRFAENLGADEHMVRRAIVASGVPGQNVCEEIQAARPPEDAQQRRTSNLLEEPVRSPVRSRSVPGLASPGMSGENEANSPVMTAPPAAPSLRPSFVPAYSMPRGRARNQSDRTSAKASSKEERPSPSVSPAAPLMRPSCTPAFYMMRRPTKLSDEVDKPDAEIDATKQDRRAVSAPEGAQDMQQKPSFLRPSCVAGYSMTLRPQQPQRPSASSVDATSSGESSEPVLRRSFLNPLSGVGASSIHKCMQPSSMQPASRVKEAKQALVDAIVSGALGAAMNKLREGGTLQQAAKLDTARVREKCSQKEAKQAIWDATVSAMANLEKPDNTDMVYTEELAETRVREVQEAFLDLMNCNEAHAGAMSPKLLKESATSGETAQPQLRRSFEMPASALDGGVMHKCMQWKPCPASPRSRGKKARQNTSKFEGKTKSDERSKEDRLREVQKAFVDAVLTGRLQDVVKSLRQEEPSMEREESVEQSSEEQTHRDAAKMIVDWAVHRCRSYDRAEQESARPSQMSTPFDAQPSFLRPSCVPGNMMIRANSVSPQISPASSSNGCSNARARSRPLRPTTEAPATRRPSRSASKMRQQKAAVPEYCARLGNAFCGIRHAVETHISANVVAAAAPQEGSVGIAKNEGDDLAIQMLEQNTRVAISNCTIEDVYNSFCTVGRAGMSSRGFAKLCKHCKLLDNACTQDDANLIFANVVLKGHRHVSYQQFETILAQLSEKLGITEDAIHFAVAAAGPGELLVKEQRRSCSRTENGRGMHHTLSTSTLGCEEVTRPSGNRTFHHRSCPTSVQDSRTPSPLGGLPSFTLATGSRSSSATPKNMPATALLQAFKRVSPTSTRTADSQNMRGTTVATKSSQAEQCNAQDADAGPTPTPPPLEDFARRAPRLKPAERLGDLLAASSQRRRTSYKVGAGQHQAAAGQHARDALDVALLIGSSQHRPGVSVEECAQSRRRGSEALGLALLAEAYDAGLDITREELAKAKKKAQGALEFTLMTKRDLDLGSEEFHDVKTHARNALQVGLLGAQRDANEQSPNSSELRTQGGPQDAVNRVLRMFAEVRCSRLSMHQLEEAKSKAKSAVNQALATDVELAGLELPPEIKQKAMRLAHANLDVALLSWEAVDEDVAETRKRASDAVHLAILGVQLCA